ncbi:putative F-box/FBD/LRR-repeat protein At4g00315 [Silene latifolia]|uniref:putative F-box/FBD/LRR-repeat protein At4g00315 n=1 Tax=Silene latifolia TaxID=37657 RepID=UPI003D77152F
MLDTKEAGRASVLSKRWYDVWSSIPFLDFQLKYFKVHWNRSKVDLLAYYSNAYYQSFLGFIDKTMQRYCTRKYRILKLNLELPMMDEKMDLLVGKWLKIAVQNQIEELELNVGNVILSRYKLPEILFRAKSLKVLNCENVVMPYYETMELISLEYLTLIVKNVDMDMFQRIITFCPLVELDITIEELGKLSLPWTRKVNEATEFVNSGIMQSNFKASPLRYFAYDGLSKCITWPWNMNVFALKNLRKLEIVCATITDDIVFELAHGLVALERLVLATCTGLKSIEVSSISLKDLAIVECEDLTEVTVDAPNLLEFWYNCELETPLSLSRVQDHCNAQFFPLFVLDSITTVWLVKLKKFLVETSAFKSLLIELSNSLV